MFCRPTSLRFGPKPSKHTKNTLFHGHSNITSNYALNMFWKWPFFWGLVRIYSLFVFRNEWEILSTCSGPVIRGACFWPGLTGTEPGRSELISPDQNCWRPFSQDSEIWCPGGSYFDTIWRPVETSKITSSQVPIDLWGFSIGYLLVICYNMTNTHQICTSQKVTKYVIFWWNSHKSGNLRDFREFTTAYLFMGHLNVEMTQNTQFLTYFGSFCVILCHFVSFIHILSHHHHLHIRWCDHAQHVIISSSNMT